jgi:hypothetical protein
MYVDDNKASIKTSATYHLTKRSTARYKPGD